MAQGNLLRSACSRLLAKPEDHPFVVHVARLLHHATANTQAPVEINSDTSPKAVVSVFRALGLIPSVFSFQKDDEKKNAEENRAVDVLFDGIATRVPCSQLAARVLFAACIHPQRMFQMGKTTLKLRLQAFISFLETSADDTSLVHALTRYLSGEMRRHAWTEADVQEIVSDLAGRTSEDPAVSQEAFSGAALYLGTCHAALLARILRFWTDDSAFLRVFRSYFPSPPSCLSPVIRDAIKAELGDQVWDRALRIERLSKSLAQKWPVYLQSPQHIQDAWEEVCEKTLSSRFPYYAFRSRFETWWCQLFGNHNFGLPTVDIDAILFQLVGEDGRDNRVPLDDDNGTAVGQEDFEPREDAESESAAATPHALPVCALPTGRGISVDLLRVYREGYRLVRASFFARDNRGTERLREAIDELWYRQIDRLLQRQDVAWGDLNPLMDEVSVRLSIRKTQLLAAYNKLRLRIWAYTLARTTSLTNDQILHVSRPRGYEKGGGPYPLKDVKGVETIASLARCAGQDYTLLWAFAAFVFLRVRLGLNARYKVDDWDFPRFAVELWRWVTDEMFLETVKYGKNQGSQADTLAWGALNDDPLIRGLLDQLVACENEERVQDLTRRRSFKTAQRRLMEIVDGLAGPACRGSPQEWREYLDWPRAVATHWVVPVWYLTVVQALEPGKQLRKLRVDGKEEDDVRRVIEKVMQWTGRL